MGSADCEMKTRGEEEDGSGESASKKLKETTEDGEVPMEGLAAANGAPPAQAASSSEPEEEPPVCLHLVFGRQKFDLNVSLCRKVEDFRKMVEEKTGVPPPMQKLMCKGPMKDGQSLREAKAAAGAKVMLVGCTLSDVVAVNTKPSKGELLREEAKSSAAGKEPLSKQKGHAKVIEKGVPEDAMPGIKNVKENLPPAPLSGMRNKHNQKVRLTFKLELDQLWLGTPERTEKIPMNRISSITSEPIQGKEEYHILGLQLGTTELSRYWIYWVPAQYVDAIKQAILG